MKLTVDSFQARFLDLVSRPDPQVVVGFSGGLDSTVLLHLCNQLRCRGVISSLRAVHVHHGLSLLADSWVRHIEAVCCDWAIPLDVGYVKVSAGGNVEDCAREARYAIFEQHLKPGELLLQAHHRDDQVETLLYRLIRGTGISGLKGIPVSRSLGQGHLARPLLGFERRDLEEYAGTSSLVWVEDDSNTDTRYDRNFLRHEVVPLLSGRWPGMKVSLARLADIACEADEMLDEVARADLEGCSREKVFPVIGEHVVLDISALQTLPPFRQLPVMRSWLFRLGLPVPGKSMLQRVVDEVVAARPDAEPVLRWEGGLVRRFRGALLAFDKPLSRDTFEPVQLGGELSLTLSNGDLVQLLPVNGDRDGTLFLKAGRDFTCSPCAGLQVRSFALPGRKGRKKLKKWLNELDVPPWVRRQLPVLHAGNEMVAIPGLFVAEGYQADAGSGCLELRWRRGS